MNVYIWWAKDYSAMQWPCDSWFHIPSKSEFDNIKTIRTWLWGWYNDGINFALYLKLPPAWLRERTDAHTAYQWSSYWYWSSTANWNNSYFLYLSSDTIQTTWATVRSRWHSIRPFKDTSVTPDSSWTKLYWTSIEAWWIFHNSTLWLISLSSDWTNWLTIADKNLWATTVWNSWDTLSESNCGKYFQRWNNYGFAFTWTISSSTTLVNASSYWPWNYYSVATFIKVSNSPYDWSSVKNDNLRWWVTWAPYLQWVEISLRTIVNTPSSDFLLTAPATLSEWEEYVIRIISEDSYTMTLGTGFTNPRNVDTSLSLYATDQFVFLAVWWVLELQPLVATWE